MKKLEKLLIGNIDQWVLFRGKNNNNPILLILQQGPGLPMISEANSLEKALKLENNYNVIYWDYRGCGKSYNKNILPSTMNLEQMINDTHELTNQIKLKMNVSKIYIMGFSIGGSIAMLVSDRYPEDYHACIAVGPDVKTDEGDKIAYNFILDKAENSKNKKALKEIKKIGYPPHLNSKNFLIRVKWVTNFGGVNRKESFNSILLKNLKNIFLSSQYSFFDILKTFKGMSFTQNALLKDLSELNMFQKIKQLKVPLYIIQGKHDYASPYILVEKFYNHLTPDYYKHLIWFENSAHSPYYEESEKFREILVNILK